MAIALDGSIHPATGSGATHAVGTLTTTNSNVVVLCVVVSNGGTVTSITDTGGHTWAKRAQTATNNCELWWTTSAAAFNNAITVNLTGSSFVTATAFGISGANFAAPFDTNGALPNFGDSGARSITTSNANDMLIYCSRLNTGNGTATATWTEIRDNSDFIFHQYKIVGATQAALSVNTAEVNNGAIADAIREAAAGGSPYTLTADTGTLTAAGQVANALYGPWKLVGVGTSVESVATGHTLTVPAGVQQGDLLVAVISSRIASTTSITLPTGGEWTRVAEQKTNNILTTGSAVASGMMAYCVRGASNPNLVFTHPVAPAPALGRIIAYRGVDPIATLEQSVSFTTAVSTTAVSGAGLTTTKPNALLVVGACGGQEAAWSVFDATNPTTASGATNTTADPAYGTWIERADVVTTTGNDTSLGIADAQRSGFGATGNLTVTASVAASHVIVAAAFNPLVVAGLTNPVMPAGTGTLTAAGQTVIPRVTLPVPLDADLTLAGQIAALRMARKTVAGLGTLAAAGQPVTLRYTRAPVVAGLGTLTAAGQVATLRYGRRMPAGLGTLVLAGQVVTIKRNYVVPVTVGTLTLAGQSAVLTEKNSYGLIASHGVLTAAGQDVALRIVRKLVAGQGTLTLAGQVVTARFAHRMVGGLGTLTLAGQTAIIRYAHNVPAGQGTLTPNGQNVTLRYSRKMPAGLGTITLAGQTVNTIYSGAGAKLLPAGLGTITLGGQTATLRYARKMTADAGTLTLSGQDVTLTKFSPITHYTMPAALGTLTLAGQAAALTKSSAVTHYRLAVEHGTLTIDGQPVVVRYAHRMAAGVGVLTISGRTVTLDTTAPATFSTLTLSGRDVTLRKINKLRMPADAGTLTLSGQALTLRRSRVPMAAGLGTLTLSGRPIALPKGRKLAAEVGSIVLTGKAAGLAYKVQIRMAAEPGILHLVEQEVALSRTTIPPVIRHETLRFGRSVYVSRW